MTNTLDNLKSYLEKEEKKKQLFEALGELCAIVSVTENLIRDIVHKIIAHKDEKIIQSVTYEMHFVPVTMLATRLFEQKSKRIKDKTRFRKLMKRARNLYGNRDEFIHSEWIVHSSKIEKIKGFISKIVKVEEIHALITKFKNLNEQLIQFRLDLFKLKLNKVEYRIIESLLSGKPLNEKNSNTKPETKS